MRGILPLIALSVVLPACTGPERLATPRITPPYGSVDNQQDWAQFHEPYPENGPGPPIAGARPREYQEPRAEVTRALQRPVVVPALAPCPQSQAPQRRCRLTSLRSSPRRRRSTIRRE